MCLDLYGHGLLVGFALLSWSGCTMSLWVGISWKEMRGSGASLSLPVFSLDNGDHFTQVEPLLGVQEDIREGFPFLICG